MRDAAPSLETVLPRIVEGAAAGDAPKPFVGVVSPIPPATPLALGPLSVLSPERPALLEEAIDAPAVKEK